MSRLLKKILIYLIPCTVVLSIAVVGLVIYFHLTRPVGKSSYFLTPFIVFAILERVWENFYTSRDKQKRKIDQDWTLGLVTVGYTSLWLIGILDYYSRLSPVYVDLMFLGITMHISAYTMRWWGIKTLSNQWSIHAIGESRISVNNRELIRKGPYKYIRHPIYAGIFLEILSIPLILNSLYALLYSIFLLIPLYALRAYLEEKNLLNVFGYGYKKYKKESGAFIPVNVPLPDQFQDRRLRQVALDQAERRNDNRRSDDRRQTDRRHFFIQA